VRFKYEDEIAVKVRALPEALKREVLYYAEFLLSKQTRKTAKKEKFDWTDSARTWEHNYPRNKGQLNINSASAAILIQAYGFLPMLPGVLPQLVRAF
jgi:hypothetical protein